MHDLFLTNEFFVPLLPFPIKVRASRQTHRHTASWLKDLSRARARDYARVCVRKREGRRSVALRKSSLSACPAVSLPLIEATTSVKLMI